MKNLKIAIIGTANTGKTTLACLIAGVLKKFDIDVIIDDMDLTNGFIPNINDDIIMKALSNNLKVNIEVIQIKKDKS